MAQVQRQPAPRYEDGDGSMGAGTSEGWMLINAALVLASATWNILGGLFGAFDPTAYESVAFSDGIDLPVTDTIEAWGWAALIIGVVMVAVAYGVFVGAIWARILGVVAASLNMVFHLAILAAFPFWSLTTIAINALIIYGLLVHGGQEDALA